MFKDKQLVSLIDKINCSDFFMYININNFLPHADLVMVDGETKQELMFDQVDQWIQVLNGYCAMFEIGSVAFRQLANETDQSVLMDRNSGRTFWAIRQS